MVIINFIEVQLFDALYSVLSPAHQGSTGGFLLLQRFCVGLSADSSSLSHLRVGS